MGATANREPVGGRLAYLVELRGAKLETARLVQQDADEGIQAQHVSIVFTFAVWFCKQKLSAFLPTVSHIRSANFVLWRKYEIRPLPFRKVFIAERRMAVR